LTLAKGDRIELVERDDEFGDGWFLGRHLSNDQTGLFPEGQSVMSQDRIAIASGAVSGMNADARYSVHHARAQADSPTSCATAARSRDSTRHHFPPDRRLTECLVSAAAESDVLNFPIIRPKQQSDPAYPARTADKRRLRPDFHWKPQHLYELGLSCHERDALGHRRTHHGHAHTSIVLHFTYQ
jgi:hypothetical protein